MKYLFSVKCITKKEIEAILKQVKDSRLKERLKELSENYDEVELETFFSEIKSIRNIESEDYRIFLILEEFYLRFKEAENGRNR